MSYFLKVTAKHLKDPSRTQPPGKSRQTVCAVRACARPGFDPTPSAPRSSPGSRTALAHACPRARAQNSDTPTRGGRSVRPTAPAQLSPAGRKILAREVPSSWQRNCVFVQDLDTCFPDAACLAMVHDARSSPFCPVAWCAGAVVYSSSTVPFCALPWKGRLVFPSPRSS